MDQSAHIRIDVTQSGDALRGFKDLTDATKAHTRETQRLTAEQAKLAAQNRLTAQHNEQLIKQATAQAAGGSPFASVGGFGRAFGYAAAGITGSIAAARYGAQATSGVINAYNDPTKNPYTRNERAWEAAPIIGGLVKSFRELYEAVSGVTAALQEMRQRAQISAARGMIQLAGEQRERGMRFEYAQAENAAIAQGRLPYVQFGGAGINRNTVQGDIQYGIAQQMTPALVGQRQAEAGVIGATRNYNSAIDIESEIRGKIASRQRTIDTVTAQINRANRPGGGRWIGDNQGGPGLSKEGRQSLDNQREQAITEQAKLQEELLAAINQKKQAGLELTKQESALRQAGIAVDQQKLAILQQQEQRIRNVNASYGSLNAAERLGARQAVERIERFGLGSASEYDRGIIGRAGGGEYLRKLYEQSSARDPNSQYLRDKFGAGGDLGAIREQQLKLESKITLDVQMDKTTLAKDVKDATLDGVKQGIEEIRQMVQIEVRKVIFSALKQRNAAE